MIKQKYEQAFWYKWLTLNSYVATSYQKQLVHANKFFHASTKFQVEISTSIQIKKFKLIKERYEQALLIQFVKKISGFFCVPKIIFYFRIKT